MKLFVSLLALTSAAARTIGGDPMTWSPVVSNHTELPKLTCQECVNIISGVETELKTNENLIESFACEMCDLLPDSSSQNECKTVAMATVPFVVSQLIVNFPANTVCEQLKFCPKQSSWWLWG